MLSIPLQWGGVKDTRAADRPFPVLLGCVCVGCSERSQFEHHHHYPVNAEPCGSHVGAACFRFCTGKHGPLVSSLTGHTGPVCVRDWERRGKGGGVLEAQEQCTVVQRPVQVLHSRGYARATLPELKQVMAESFSRAFQRKTSASPLTQTAIIHNMVVFSLGGIKYFAAAAS